jgi:3'-5' exoribonuclease
MVRRFISTVGEQESIREVFRVAEKQLRPNRNGNLYLQMELSDRSGTLSARLWNTNDAIQRSFDVGDYVLVEGATQIFQGALQLIVSRVMKVDRSEVNEDDFTPVSTVEVDKLLVRLGELLRTIRDPALKTLAECYLMDEAFMGKLARAPAGVKHHHAYIGGLLEHIVNLMEVVVRIAPCYPKLNRDLLLMGAFLHDSSKVDELVYDREFTYSDEGQLIGHVVMAVSMLEKKVAQAEKLSGEPVPADTVLRLKHLLVSHHGQYEYGSPKLPMTLEAVALYCLDNLDAKIAAFSQQMRDDPNVESPWTMYNPSLGRKLYKSKEE